MMRPMTLVLNEWVFHDLMRENGDQAFLETSEFLLSFCDPEHSLIVPYEPRWHNKANQLTLLLDPAGRQASKSFHLLLRDIDRAISIRAEDMQPLLTSIPHQVPDEDVYLVLAYLAGNADLLVTTDHGLFDALASEDAINCQMREHFLAGYLSAP